MAADEIDRVRGRSALAVVKQHPGMVLFLASPAIIGLIAVWWLAGAGWAALLLVALVLGGESRCSSNAEPSGLGHLPVLTAPGQQLGMSAALDDTAGLHHQDLVGVADRRQPVGDDETRPVPA